MRISLMLGVEDADAAVRWYREALGATVLWDVGGVAGLAIDGAEFFVGEAGNTWHTPAELGGTTTRVEVFTDDPDAFATRAAAAGATYDDEVRDHETPWGPHRQGGFTDPFGHRWLVGDPSPLSAHPT
jgi:PhnB protein